MTAEKRRWLCRVLFIMLAVIPTLVISVWGGWAHTTRIRQEQQEAWQRRVVQELGLVGRARRLEHGDRGDVILDGVALIDPETEQAIATIRRVHAAPAGERGWVIEASYPQLAAENLLRLWTPIYDRLRYSRGTLDWSGLVTAHHVTLQHPNRSQTLSHLECQFGSSRSGSFAKLEFLVDGVSMSRRAELVVARDRSSPNPETFVVLNTGPQPLPCSLAYSALPSLAHLGDACHFQGQLKLRQNDEEGWRGDELTGTLAPVDFATLITGLFPHHLLTGKATLEIRRAIFENGRLISAEGVVSSRDGRISRSLLLGAAEHLGWHIADAVRETSDSRFPYAELRFEFKLDESGLSVLGKCGEPGVILLGSQGPLAWESGEVRPVTDCLSLLVPDSTHQVPATRQTGWLAAMLPVPDIRPAHTAIRPESPPLRFQQQR